MVRAQFYPIHISLDKGNVKKLLNFQQIILKFEHIISMYNGSTTKAKILN